MKKTFTKLLFFIFVFTGTVYQARADHMVGSDISWKCLGGDTFAITITVYRDCNGIAFQNSPFVLTPVGANCTGSAQTISGSSSGGRDITPVCGKSCSRCVSNASCPFPFGIQQFFITAVVVLPTGCCDYEISWTQCCRSAGISTGATWANYYISSQMSRCTFGYCDNSPYFTNPPVAIYCTNQCVIYNPAANDDDRDANGNPDSLVYSLTDPLTAEGAPTPWSGNYSSTQPLDYDGFPNDTAGIFNPPASCKGFHLNPETGELDFKAVKPDVTVIALKIEEYRKDSLGVYEKIGEIRRDMQIMIIDCPANHPPNITGINGGNLTSATFCADQTTCFTIKAFDLDPPDSDYLSWNDQIPTATFMVTPDNKKWPTATFCWRPSLSDVRIAPYRFVVTALDNACPVPGRTNKVFAITVIAPPEAEYGTIIQACGLVKFNATSSGRTAITSYVWTGEGAKGYGPLYSISPSFSYKYTRAGTYHYTLTIKNAKGCETSYPDSVVIPPYVYVSLPPDKSVCADAAPITITATFGLGNKPYYFYWNTNDSGPNTTSITKKITKDTSFVVTIKDGNGCTNYDSMKVHYQKLPQPNLGPDQRGCSGHLLTLDTKLKGIDKSTFWTKILGNDTTKNFFIGNPAQVVDSGIYTAFVKDSVGCPGSDTINIHFNPLVKARSGDTDVCINDSVPMFAGVAGPGSTFRWFDRAHPTITLSTTNQYTLPSATDIFGYPIEIIISQTIDNVTCADTGLLQINVHPKPVPILKPLPDKCLNDNAFPLSVFVDANHQTGGYWYYPKNYGAIVGEYLYPFVMGVTANDPTLGWVHYHYTDQFKCTTDDSERIIVSTLPQVYAGPDSEICTANGLYLLNDQSRINPTGGQWVACKATSKSLATPPKAISYSTYRDSVFFNPLMVPMDSVYGVVYEYTQPTGKTNCSNNDTVYIKVKTNPVIILTQIPPLCQTSNTQQLTASPGGGVWQFQDGTNPAALTYDVPTASYIFDPSLAGTGYHKLAYTAWADRQRKLCSSIDTMSIYVVPAPVISFKTEDNKYEYCESHAVVKLVPNQNWPGGEFTGKGVYNTGGIFYFDPTGKTPTGADTTGDSTKNTVTYSVPYNGGNCNITAVRHIAVDEHPFVSISTSAAQCSGSDHIDLVADVHNIPDAAHLIWNSPDGNQQPFLNIKLVGNTATATYYPTQQQSLTLKYVITLTGFNNGVCDTARSVDTITIHPRPAPDFKALNPTGCEPLAVNFISSYTLPGKGSIGSYNWDFGDGTTGTGATTSHTYRVTNGQASQKFAVKLVMTTNFYNCSGEKDSVDYITVYATPRPRIYANPQVTSIAVPQVQFNVDATLSTNVDFKSPSTTYAWTFGDTGKLNSANIRNPIHVYSDTGSFRVLLHVFSNQCVGIDSLTIHVQPELIIFIPNVFKPNGKDGLERVPHPDNYFSLEENQTFQPVISDYLTFEMSVYNRWGELMYTTNDPKKGWDGKYQGGDPKQDAYVYVIKATSYSGKPYTFTGTVTLIN